MSLDKVKIRPAHGSAPKCRTSHGRISLCTKTLRIPWKWPDTGLESQVTPPHRPSSSPIEIQWVRRGSNPCPRPAETSASANPPYLFQNTGRCHSSWTQVARFLRDGMGDRAGPTAERKRGPDTVQVKRQIAMRNPPAGNTGCARGACNIPTAQHFHGPCRLTFTSKRPGMVELHGRTCLRANPVRSGARPKLACRQKAEAAAVCRANRTDIRISNSAVS